MKIYLVGGAVRDLLLKRKNGDKDYVIVGATADIMLSLGYKSIGNFFPVFIHVQKEGEYALARTEKKSGVKHFDFECFTQDVSLKEDMKRRDLTINAIAYDEEKSEFIDYFQGLDDIKDKILRPVSEAFKEDPLRILRAARIKAQLGNGWRFDKLLIKYANDIKNDLQYISKERIYQETKKALGCEKPSIFFESLLEFGVLENIFLWLYRLKNENKTCFGDTLKALDFCKDKNAKWAILFQYVKNFTEVKNTLSLTKNELKTAMFFAANQQELQNLFLNKLSPREAGKLLFGIKDKKVLSSLLEATVANIRGKSYLTKKQLENLWEFLLKANYEVDDKMDVKKIKEKVAKKQEKIVKDFIKKYGKKIGCGRRI